MNKTIEETQKGNKQLEQYLIKISSDIVIARSALHYCYSTMSPQNCGPFKNCVSMIRHFATTAMAIHLSRVFEVQVARSKKNSVDQPSFSIISLADFLASANIKTMVDSFYNLLDYVNGYDDKCITCIHDIPHHMSEDCLFCLPRRLGSITKRRCAEANELVTKVKKFRNKWVAHTEMPTKAIPTTYADFELLTNLAEDLLFPFSRYFPTAHCSYYYDVVEQKQATQFSKELENLFASLALSK